MTQRDAESRFNIHSINLKGLTADPTDVRDGDVWYRSDAGTLHIQVGATKKTVTLT